MKKLKKLLFILMIVSCLVSLLPLSVVAAPTTYTVTSGASNLFFGSPGTNNLVRWPNGTLITTYTLLIGSAYEVRVAYSVDEGLNWITWWTSSFGYNMHSPCIQLDDDFNLHLAWAGKVSASNYDGDAVYYKKYDYATGTWGSTEIAYQANNDSYDSYDNNTGDNVVSVGLVVDSSGIPSVSWHMEEWGVYFKERQADGWHPTETQELVFESATDNIYSLATGNYYGQEFTTTGSFTVGAIGFKGRSTIYDVSISIVPMSGGTPNWGSQLSVTWVDGAEISDTEGWNYFSVTPYVLSASTQYCLQLAPQGNFPDWSADDHNGYAGGESWIASVQDAGKDFFFKLYSVEGVEIIDSTVSQSDYIQPVDACNSEEGFRGYGGLGMAIDRDDNIGVSWSTLRFSGALARPLEFRLRSSAGVWDAIQTVDTGSVNKGFRASALATRYEGASCFWELVASSFAWGGGTSYTHYVYQYQRAGGGWSAAYTLDSQSAVWASSFCPAVALDHTEGDYYAVWSYAPSCPGTSATSYVKYKKYVSGVGWDATQTIISETGNYRFMCPSAAHREVPYYEDPETGFLWHYNLPAANLAVLYTKNLNSGANDSGYFYLTGDWGSFPPIVVTTGATGVTTSSATLNGNLTTTGGEAVTTIGFQWGLTQTPTWSWSDTSVGFSVGAYDHTISVSSGTTYYYRIYATNSEGTSYGEWLGFNTLGSSPTPTPVPTPTMPPWGSCTTAPDISTRPATYVSVTTARLNAYLNDDGGGETRIRFQYYSGGGTWTDNETSWVGGYWDGNPNAYVDISSLAGNTTYHFRAQAMNFCGNDTGADLTFTTAVGISAPTNPSAIAKLTEPTIDVTWTMASSTFFYMVRYKTGSFPGNTSDGTGTVVRGTSATLEDLTPGTTYYIRIWGASGGTYSGNYTDVKCTTTSASGPPGLPAMGGGNWFTSVDYTHMSSLPIYDIVNEAADTIGMPYNTLWFIIAMFFVALFTLATFFASNGNLVATVIMLVFAMIGGTWLHLVPGFMALIAGLMAAGLLSRKMSPY